MSSVPMRAGSLTVLAALLLATALPRAASADVQVVVDKGAQRMEVTVDGVPRYAWPVSTGVAAHDTPSGAYRPFRMERTHFSKEWDDAPMPFALFFTNQGHAIHGTGHLRNLGRPASHGCVRLSVRNAATLFSLVKAQGMGRTSVRIEGRDMEGRDLDNDPPVADRGARAYRSAGRRGYGSDAASFDDDQTGTRTAYYPVRRPAYAPVRGYGSRTVYDDMGGW